MNGKSYDVSCVLVASSLDVIIDKLGGPSKVAEMTGRRARIVRNPSGRVVYEVRQSGCVSDQSLNVREVSNC